MRVGAQPVGGHRRVHVPDRLDALALLPAPVLSDQPAGVARLHVDQDVAGGVLVGRHQRVRDGPLQIAVLRRPGPPVPDARAAVVRIDPSERALRVGHVHVALAIEPAGRDLHRDDLAGLGVVDRQRVGPALAAVR